MRSTTLFAVLAVSLLSTTAHAADEYATAVLIRGKNRTVIDRISISSTVKYRTLSVRGVHKGKFSTVPFSRLTQIEYDKGTAVIHTKDKKRYVLTKAGVGNEFNTHAYIEYECFNDLEQKNQTFRLKTASDPKAVFTLILGTESGDLKQNPKTKQFFPIDYRFDPYTGEKLILAKEEDHSEE
jgi:hypothetical protein